MVSFAISAVLALASADPASESISKIVVEGAGSVKTPPNVATISYDVQGEGASSDRATEALVSKSAAVEDALRSVDPALELRSAKVSVQAVRGGKCQDDEYDERPRLSVGDCAIVGYIAKQDFEVRTLRVVDAGTMVGLAGREGAAQPKIDDFGLVDQADARRQAIAAALADAKSKAEAIVAGTNARLGEVISISLDGARENEMVVVTGSRRRRDITANAPVSVKVAPGPVYTTAQVTVSYSILR